MGDTTRNKTCAIAVRHISEQSGSGDIGLNTLMTPQYNESTPRCLPSYLPFIAANINTYASMRNMRLNEKKCKDMVINFLKYQPTVITPIQLNGPLPLLSLITV